MGHDKSSRPAFNGGFELLQKGWTPQASSSHPKVGSGGSTPPSGGSAVSSRPSAPTPAKKKAG